VQGETPAVRRRWRDYRTAAGRRPLKDVFDELSDSDAAAVVAAMEEVRQLGLTAARHLHRDIYEVRAEGDKQIFRILFATEGRSSRLQTSSPGASAAPSCSPGSTNCARSASCHRRSGSSRYRGTIPATRPSLAWVAARVTFAGAVRA
jgi:hypothetical protein